MVRFRGKSVRNAEAFREECVRAQDALSNLPDGECGVKDQVSPCVFNVDLSFGSMALRARLGLESGMQKFLDISQCLQEF